MAYSYNNPSEPESYSYGTQRPSNLKTNPNNVVPVDKGFVGNLFQDMFEKVPADAVSNRKPSLTQEEALAKLRKYNEQGFVKTAGSQVSDTAVSAAKTGGKILDFVGTHTGDFLWGTGSKKETPIGKVVPVDNPFKLLEADMASANAQISKGRDEWFSNKFKDLKNSGLNQEQFLEELGKYKTQVSPEVYQAAEKAVVDKGKPVIPGVKNPVVNPDLEKVKQQQTNINEGKGDANGNVTPAPSSPADNQVALNIDSASTMLANQNAAPLNWYDSQAFNRGLITFGLGLLSGQDYATAFSNAAADFDVNYQAEKRGMFQEELLADGYSQAQVMEWIQSGDASILKKEVVKPVDFWSRPMIVGDKYVSRNALTGEYKQVAGLTEGELTARGSSPKGSGGKAPTESQVKSEAYGSRSEYALRDFTNAWQAASEEMEESFFPNWVYRAGGDVIGQGSEGPMGALGVRATEASYPELAKYRQTAMRTLMPLMRSDSGATIGKAEEQKEFMAGIPQPGDSPEQFQAKMDDTMFRIAEEFSKKPGNDHYGVVNQLVVRGQAKWVPTSMGLLIAYNGSLYEPKELYELLGGQ